MAEEGRAVPDCSYYIPVAVAVAVDTRVGVAEVVAVVVAAEDGKDRVVAAGHLVHRDMTPCERWVALARDWTPHHVSGFLGCVLVR